jgi:DNA-binding NarL/FixJ family response regulator
MRLLLIDDHPLIRIGLRERLGGAGHEIVGEAENLLRARALIATAEFDIAIIDLSLPDGDGMTLIEPEHLYIVLTLGEDPRTLKVAYERGAAAYVRKSEPLDQLISIIEQVGVIGPVMVKPQPQNDPYRLSPRELEILTVLATGATSREIASRLFLSEATVKTHLASINRKLEVNNRTAAIAKARESNLL